MRTWARAGIGVLFYLYADDLDGLGDHLLANGMRVGEIVDGSPGHERRCGSPTQTATA